MEKNIIYNVDCVIGMRKYLENESVDLVIADPPYFKVTKEKWDYFWRTEKDYLEWSKLWITEVSRILRKGGSFYVFGYFRMLAYLVPLIESCGFKLKQQILLSKGIQSISGRATKNYKMFPNTTESVLLFYKDARPFIKELLLERQKVLGLKSKEINEALGVKSNGGGMWSIYTGNNVCEQIPTYELWQKLQEILKFEYPYDKLEQTFNAQMGYTDVWDMKTYNIKNRIHPTQKPSDIIRRMIMASSNEGDLVVDPFMGSGETAVSCKKLNRNYVGFEIDKEYHDLSLQYLEK